MQNYFYTILPEDIQIYIFQLRLSMQLQKNYYRIIAQKMTIADLVLKYKLKHFTQWEYNHFNSVLHNPFINDTYMDTKDIKTLFLLKKGYQIIRKTDDIIWWLHKLIFPIERSMILYEWFPAANNQLHENDNIYYECYDYYFKLLKKLNVSQSIDLIDLIDLVEYYS